MAEDSLVALPPVATDATRSCRSSARSLARRYEFVFPDGGSAVGAGYLWIRDPPNGKGQSTTDPDFAAPSFAVLDKIVVSVQVLAGFVCGGEDGRAAGGAGGQVGGERRAAA